MPVPKIASVCPAPAPAVDPIIVYVPLPPVAPAAPRLAATAAVAPVLPAPPDAPAPPAPAEPAWQFYWGFGTDPETLNGPFATRGAAMADA